MGHWLNKDDVDHKDMSLYTRQNRIKISTNDDLISPYTSAVLSLKSQNYDTDDSHKHRDSSFLTQHSPLTSPNILTHNEKLLKKEKLKTLIIILVPTLVLLIAAIIVSSIYHPILLPNTRQRPFDINDPKISNPYLTESVSSGGLVGIIVVVAIFVTICGTVGGLGSIYFGKKYWKKRILALAASMGITAGFLDILTIGMKVGIAALRPDFLSRCRPDVLTHICTNDDLMVVVEGRVSFPSGHSSWSMYSCALLSLMVGQLALYVYKMFVRSGKKYIAISIAVLGSLLCVSSLIPGVVVAATRVTDNRHFVRDVVVGGILGVVAGVGCYVLYRVFSVLLISTAKQHRDVTGEQQTVYSQTTNCETGYDTWIEADDDEDRRIRDMLAMIPSPSLGVRTKESLSFHLSPEATARTSPNKDA